MDFSYGNLMAVAQNVPHLNVALSRGADIFSSMKLRHVDKDNNDIKDSEVIKLLRNPNPLQNQQEWLYMFYIYMGIYNSVFGYKNYARDSKYRGNDLPSLLWWLPSGEMKINLSGKIYRQNRLEDIILNYTLFLDPEPYNPDEIIYLTEGVIANGVAAGNRLEAMQIPLSNIVAALKSQNIIISERGLIGFISSDGGNKDSDGALPFDKKERKRAEKDYSRKYSLDQEGGHVTFTNSAIKWVPMTFDMKQLMLFEGLESDFCQILAAYGLDRKLFPASILAPAGLGNSADVEAAMKATIQNAIQPLANKLMSKLEAHFNIDGVNEKLISDYSDLPVMQQDELTSQQAFNQKVAGLDILFKSGIISAKQFAELAEVKMDGSGEPYQAPVQIDPNNLDALPPKNNKKK